MIMKGRSPTMRHVSRTHRVARVERYCELANKKVKQLYNVSSLRLDDHHLKREELESVGK